MLIDKADTKLPELVEDMTCQLGLWDNGKPKEGNGADTAMAWMVAVSPDDMMKVRNGCLPDYVAFPNVFAILHHATGDVLAVWPKPDQPYEGIFEYCPKRKQI